MSKAIADPQELRRFAQDLQRTNADLQAALAALQARFDKLSESWRDQERDKFAESFEEATKVLRKFVEDSSRFAPLLQRKAAKLEEYLDAR